MFVRNMDRIFQTITGSYKYKIKSITNKGFEIKFLNGPRFDSFTIFEKFKSNVFKGNIKHPYHNYVLGVAHLGIVKCIDKTAYMHWYEMIRRCYGGRNSAYRDVTVDENFREFAYFQKWMKKMHYIPGFELDKDLKTLGVYKNKIYSENMCVFIPKAINNFLKRRDNDRGDEVIGVSRCPGGFKARVSVCGSRFTIYTETELDAFLSYRCLKHHALEVFNMKFKDTLSDDVKRCIHEYIFIDETGKYSENFIKSFTKNEEKYISEKYKTFDSVCMKISSIIYSY